MVVLVLAFTVFNYLNSLNKEIESITQKSNRLTVLTDEIRISAVSILKYQRQILIDKTSTPEMVDKIVSLCDSFSKQLQTLDSMYRDKDVTKIINQMLGYVDSLKVVISKTSLFYRDSSGLSTIGDLSDKILDSFSEFQDIQYFQSVERDRKIKNIINETKKNMMITLIIGFLGTIILGLVIPGKIALPFKKIKDAIRELQDCNFDVSIFYNQEDEIGEIAKEMNKMINSLKIFEELRANRIAMENRKFDALANMVKRPVLVADAGGHIKYMNNRVYSLIKVQSEDVINKEMRETVLPKSIIDCYETAIKRRSKIENAQIVITTRSAEVEDSETINAQASNVAQANTNDDLASEGTLKKEKVWEEVVFEGYANVIPIRGKESSLDYYLMVLSSEVFA